MCNQSGMCKRNRGTHIYTELNTQQTNETKCTSLPHCLIVWAINNCVKWAVLEEKHTFFRLRPSCLKESFLPCDVLDFYARAHKYTHAPIHTRTFARNRCRNSRTKTFFAENCSLSAIRNRGSRRNRGQGGRLVHATYGFHVIHGFDLAIKIGF